MSEAALLSTIHFSYAPLDARAYLHRWQNSAQLFSSPTKRTATLACYKALSSKNPQLVRHWEVTGSVSSIIITSPSCAVHVTELRDSQAKIALQAKTEEQLLELDAIAKSLNLCARLVHSK